MLICLIIVVFYWVDPLVGFQPSKRFRLLFSFHLCSLYFGAHLFFESFIKA